MMNTSEANVDLLVSEFRKICTGENIKELLTEDSRASISNKFFNKKSKPYKKLKNIVSKYYSASKNDVYNINEILIRRARFTFDGLEARSGDDVESLAYRMFQDYILKHVSEDIKMQIIKRTTHGR